ncbi:MAG: hypothetical protein CMQ20_00515 [Gammaproteobacteria bacterium]|nr:hypothetical protein [Gammaproteobacteria bacterium]
MNPGKINMVVVFLLGSVFAGYSVWVHLQAGDHPASGSMNEIQARGAQVWRRSNCQACHQVYGSGGYLGPDLTNVASRCDTRRIESVLMEGSPPMPRFELSGSDRAALVEFFRYVDATGTWPRQGWPPPDFTQSGN